MKFLLFLENKIFAYIRSVLADCYAVIIYFISSPKKIGMILVLQMGNGSKRAEGSAPLLPNTQKALSL